MKDNQNTEPENVKSENNESETPIEPKKDWFTHKRLITIFVSLAALFFAAIYLSSIFTVNIQEVVKGNPVEISKINPLAADPIDEKPKDVHIGIGFYHDYFNSLVCWNAYQNLEFDKKTIRELQKVKDRTEELASLAKTTELKEDLMDTADYIRLAIVNENVDHLIFAHRMFHDLDMGLNGENHGDYWGVTQSVSTSNSSY